MVRGHLSSGGDPRSGCRATRTPPCLPEHARLGPDGKCAIVFSEIHRLFQRYIAVSSCQFLFVIVEKLYVRFTKLGEAFCQTNEVVRCRVGLSVLRLFLPNAASFDSFFSHSSNSTQLPRYVPLELTRINTNMQRFCIDTCDDSFGNALQNR
jgi:hypothetical protein